MACWQSYVFCGCTRREENSLEQGNVSARSSTSATSTAEVDASQPPVDNTRPGERSLAFSPERDERTSVHASVSPMPSARHPIDTIPEGEDYHRALEAIEHGDVPIARQIAARLAAHPTYSPLARAIHAYESVHQDDYHSALQMAEELSTIPVMRREAYVIAGEVFQRKGQWMAALDAFQQALKEDPNCLRAHRWLAVLYYDTGAMRLATNHLRRVAELDSRDTRSLMLSGRIFADYEQFSDAIEDYQKVLQRELSIADEMAVRLELADALIHLRRLDEAQDVLSQCPTDLPATMALRASLAEAIGDLEMARDLAAEAFRRSPDNIKAQLILGRVLVAMEAWESAIEVLRQAVNSHPYDHRFRTLLGRSLISSGRDVEGKQEIARATELKDLFLQFADLHQEAIRHPHDANIRKTLAEYARRLGKMELAAAWERAAEALAAPSPSD